MTQPPVEVACGAPLQITESDDMVIVEIRNGQGKKVQLKQFTVTEHQ